MNIYSLRNKSKHIIVTLFGLFIISLSIFTSNISANELSGTVGGKPGIPRDDNPRSISIFVHEIGLGESVDDAVLLINSSDQSKTVELYATDSVMSSGGAFACKQKVEDKLGVGLWVSLESNSVVVEPNSTILVPFSITVPQNAGVGEHNGCIAFQTLEAPVDTSVPGIQLSFRSAIRVAITVPGDIEKSLDFRERVVSTSDDSIIVTERLYNGGNVSLDVDVLSIVDPILFGETATQGGIFPILPKQESEFNFSYKKPFWGGFISIKSMAMFDSNVDSSLGLGEPLENSTIESDTLILFVMPQKNAMYVYLLTILAILIIKFILLSRYLSYKKLVKNAVIYRTNPGETINSIANKVGCSWKTIAVLNKLKAPYALDTYSEIKVVYGNKKNI